MSERANEASGTVGASRRDTPREEAGSEHKWLRVIAASELPEGDRRTVSVGGHTIVLFNSHGRLFAVDNRCPHMGFPLDRGTVQDCILTCHWHHARFDLETGGTFDQWADDVRVFPVRIEDGAVLVDVGERGDRRQHFLRHLGDGIERDIRLVIAKSVIARTLSGGIFANIDCLLERDGFELAGDFVNGQQVIRKHQRVRKWLPQRSADVPSVSGRLRAGGSRIAPTSATT